MASYTPLLQQDKFPGDEDEPHHTESVGVCDCDTHYSRHADTQWEKRALRFAIYACLASMACTFLNISFLAFRKVFVTNDIKYAHIQLETPSSYIGLERAVHSPNAPPPKPISNFPFFTAQVNQSEPGTVFLENNRHFTDFGTAWPTDRKFRVVAGVSTIMQFRVQDFGMEKCTLTLSTGMTTPDSGHSHGRDMHEHVHPMGQMDLWKLDQDRRLDPHLVSWKTRPQRSRLVTSWDLAYSTSLRTEEFYCKSTSILTFELACSGQEDCNLDFTQPRENPESALLLIQRSSL
ncbi:hypothetical protein DFH07DRAFT_950196 [Mycena maculata]|uniref:Ubiquitin 3 binding protein But2 C-terminal domain-containing protein n=1 Tax=Mycena maculata TaxID=230809 RepID=A0AAD7KA66_9AGAR|nr:hypothetical protein DFH07DRAFT_950196 [Mycena maculata]